MSRCAVITGIAGQTGSYLLELLLEKDYYVYGFVRRTASDTCRERIVHLESHPRVKLVYGDLTDSTSISSVIYQALKHPSFVQSEYPLEIYNLAAQSHVKISFELPIYTTHTDALGTLHFLESIRQLSDDVRERVRFYQASTSEMFGSSPPPQNETTQFHPRSPYGVAKIYAHWITVNYRESYNIWACAGILFNHESERRCKNFVTRKVTSAVAQHAFARQHGLPRQPLQLGNLDALRDWGYAPDYAEGIWMIMQQTQAREYVLATGISHTVRYLVEIAFKRINIDIAWRNSGAEEKGYDTTSNELLIEVNPKFYRPAEVEFLLGDCTLARQALGWKPKITFEDMIGRMVDSDYASNTRSM